MKKTIITISSLVIILLACNQSDKNTGPKDENLQNLLNNDSSGNTSPAVTNATTIDNTPPVISFTDTSTNINDVWVLDSINGKALNMANFQFGTPYFEFNTGEKKIKGHTGCNSFEGSATVADDKIEFGQLAGPKNSCKNMDFEKNFQKNISGKTVPYSFQSGKLILNTGGKNYITFRRIMH